MTTHTLARDTRARVDSCTEARCYHDRYGPALYHPGHQLGLCPRYVPNVEHHCTDCGSPTNYRHHASWCPHSTSTAAADALRAVADEIAEVDRIAKTPFDQTTEAEIDFYHGHPLADLVLMAGRPHIVQWLRDKADLA